MQTRKKRISVQKKISVVVNDASVRTNRGQDVGLQSPVIGHPGCPFGDGTMLNSMSGDALFDAEGDSTLASRSRSTEHSMPQDDLTAADKIDMQLLILEDGERSRVMHKLVNGFKQKVQSCIDSFSPDLTLSCLRIVTSVSALKPLSKTPHKSKSKDSITVGEGITNRDSDSPVHHDDPFSELDYNEAMTRELPNFTVSRLRTTIQQILRRATLRQDGSLYFPGASQTAMATKSVQYFIWYFEFNEYLQELHTNFVERIFAPMFKYFNDFNLLGANGRTTTMSSAFSKFSQFVEGTFSDEDQDGDEDVDETVLREQAKTSLKSLSGEYKDIKSIYDTSEIDKIAQRLSLLKDQIDILLDEEDEIDPELYSHESGKMIRHLDIDFGTENLIRLVPDILVKLRKAAWLVGRWLELDDQRTKDANEKLQKIGYIEEQLTKRLDVLRKDVSRDEKLLEKETNELNNLMERETRSEQLNVKTYDLKTRIEHLQNDLGMLKKERDGFAPQLDEIVKNKNLRDYHKLKFRFESNKLQRFVLERKLASLNYQRNLLTDDLKLELFIRPSVIHSSNKLQDNCERLEKVIREQKEKMSTIKNALIPIQEDKTSLTNRLHRQMESEHVSRDNYTSKNNHLSQGHGGAKHVRSIATKPLEKDKSLQSANDVKTIPQEPDSAIYVRSFYDRGTLNTPLPSIPTKLPLEGKASTRSRPGPSVQPRTFLIRRIPVVGNNRAARTISPTLW